MAAQFQFQCFSCGISIESQDRPGFRMTCDRCGSDIHCCRNCRFYDPKVYNECLETAAEVVRDKERANFCEFFEPGTKRVDQKSAADELRAKAEALFRKK